MLHRVAQFTLASLFYGAPPRLPYYNIRIIKHNIFVECNFIALIIGIVK